MPCQNKERVFEYDLIRVILTIMVVFGHSLYLEWGGDNGFISCVGATIHPINGSTYVRVLGFLQSWVYRFHMPVFFMLSGACFHLSASGGGNYWKLENLDALAKKKINKLIVPVALAALLYMFPIKRIVGFYNNDSLASSICYFFSGINVYGHLWFPLALFWIFILFFLIMITVGKRSKILCLLVAFGIEPLCSKLIQIYPTFGLYEIERSVYYLKYFVIGFYFDQYRGAISSLPGKTAIGAGLILISLLSVCNEFIGISKLFEEMIISLIVWFALFCLSTVANKSKIRSNRCYRAILNSCFQIYLFHDPLNFIWIKIAGSSSLLSHSWGVIGFYLLRFVGSIIISMLIGYLIRYFLSASKGMLRRLTEKG